MENEDLRFLKIRDGIKSGAISTCDAMIAKAINKEFGNVSDDLFETLCVLASNAWIACDPVPDVSYVAEAIADAFGKNPDVNAVLSANVGEIAAKAQRKAYDAFAGMFGVVGENDKTLFCLVNACDSYAAKDCVKVKFTEEERKKWNLASYEFPVLAVIVTDGEPEAGIKMYGSDFEWRKVVKTLHRNSKGMFINNGGRDYLSEEEVVEAERIANGGR